MKEIAEKIILGSGSAIISFVGDLPEIDLGDRHVLLIVAGGESKVDFKVRSRVELVGADDVLEAKAYPFLVRDGYRYQILAPKSPDPLQKERLENLLGFLRSSGINISTVRAFGGFFSENIIRNTPEVCRADSVRDLQGKRKGIPAILIASGPSLNEAIPALRGLRGNVVMIAADSLISFLPSQGIEPDYFVSVDPQKATHDKIGGAISNATLFFHPAAYHLIPREWQGPLLTTSTQMAPYRILRLPEAHGHVEEDVQCQMHLAFNLAAWMGCDPIILVGQDLCYHDEKLYAEGVQYIKDEEKGRVLAGTFEARNVRGNIVRTTTVFESYRTTFERKIRSFNGKVLNATTGGINIKGADNVNLEDLGESFSRKSPGVGGIGGKKDQFFPFLPIPDPRPRAWIETAKDRLRFLNDCLMVSLGVLPGDEKLMRMVRATRETLGRMPT